MNELNIDNNKIVMNNIKTEQIELEGLIDNKWDIKIGTYIENIYVGVENKETKENIYFEMSNNDNYLEIGRTCFHADDTYYVGDLIKVIKSEVRDKAFEVIRNNEITIIKNGFLYNNTYYETFEEIEKQLKENEK